MGEKIVDRLCGALETGWAGQTSVLAVHAGGEHVAGIVAAVAAAVARVPRRHWRGHPARIGAALASLGRLGPAGAETQIVTIGRAEDGPPDYAREGMCGPPRISTATGGVLIVSTATISPRHREIVADSLIHGAITSGSAGDLALLPTYPVRPAAVLLAGSCGVEDHWLHWGPMIHAVGGGSLGILTDGD